MTTPIDFYLQQAEICARAAEATPLANQREVMLRSREAWQAMAERKRAVLDGRSEQALADAIPAPSPQAVRP